MIEKPINRLDLLINTIPSLLTNIEDSNASLKPSPDKWSKKEILGHLIDSATNNHQRFIRGQFEDVPTISYDQNQWNRLNHYNEIALTQLIVFWMQYNKHL